MFLLVNLMMISIPIIITFAIFRGIIGSPVLTQTNNGQNMSQMDYVQLFVPVEGTFEEKILVQGSLVSVYKLQYSINGVRKVEQISEFHYRSLAIGQMIPVIMYSNGESHFDINTYLQIINTPQNFSESEMSHDSYPEQESVPDMQQQTDSEQLSYPISENSNIDEEINENDPSFLGLDRNPQKHKRMG